MKKKPGILLMHQQKHYEGVNLFIVKRTFILEVL